MALLIFFCLALLLLLLRLLRTGPPSLGLPVAYLYALLLIHLPGALARVLGGSLFFDSDLIATGMQFTAAACSCFVLGVWLSRLRSPSESRESGPGRVYFSWFCLLGGWACVYGLSPLYRFPSVGAAVDKGGAIWMLGVLLGLRSALRRFDAKRIFGWCGALLVYPFLMLLLGGFLSYGSTAIIIVCSSLTVFTRSFARVVAGIVIFSYCSLSIFVSYSQHRYDIRDKVWGGAPLEERLHSLTQTVSDFEWFNPNNPRHLTALDDRLNQNYFVGLAAQRIDFGLVSYLKGESLWQGLLSVVPRALWPEKPVFGGSPEIVAKMTGLRLSPTTSFGVGNVMEFQINFGYPGVIIGFLVLGWMIGWLDLKAGTAEQRGNLGRTVLFFLPCVALVSPGGSIVEMTGGAAAAVVAAFGWRWLWDRWLQPRPSWKRSHPDGRGLMVQRTSQ